MRDAPNSGQKFYVITADNQVNTLVAEPETRQQIPQTEMPTESLALVTEPGGLRSALTQTAHSVGQFVSNIRNTKY